MQFKYPLGPSPWGPGLTEERHTGSLESPWSRLSSQRLCRHHLLPPVWPQRAAGEGQEQYLPAGGRLPGLPAEEPGLALGGLDLRSCQPPIVSGTLEFQQLLPRQWARRIYSWTEPESSLTASDLKKQKTALIKRQPGDGLGPFLPLLWETFTSWPSPSP